MGSLFHISAALLGRIFHRDQSIGMFNLFQSFAELDELPYGFLQWIEILQDHGFLPGVRDPEFQQTDYFVVW